MPALDFSMGLAVIRRTAHMLHALILEPSGQVIRDVLDLVVAAKPWPAREGDVVQTRGRECLIQCRRDVGSAHNGAEPRCSARSRPARSGDPDPIILLCTGCGRLAVTNRLLCNRRASGQRLSEGRQSDLRIRFPMGFSTSVRAGKLIK